MKSTPKSCSCTQCRRGKASKVGKQLMRWHERAFRRRAKAALARVDGDDNITPAPIPGARYD